MFRVRTHFLQELVKGPGLASDGGRQMTGFLLLLSHVKGAQRLFILAEWLFHTCLIHQLYFVHVTKLLTRGRSRDK